MKKILSSLSKKEIAEIGLWGVIFTQALFLVWMVSTTTNKMPQSQIVEIKHDERPHLAVEKFTEALEPFGLEVESIKDKGPNLRYKIRKKIRKPDDD